MTFVIAMTKGVCECSILANALQEESFEALTALPTWTVSTRTNQLYQGEILWIHELK